MHWLKKEDTDLRYSSTRNRVIQSARKMSRRSCLLGNCVAIEGLAIDHSTATDAEQSDYNYATTVLRLDLGFEPGIAEGVPAFRYC